MLSVLVSNEFCYCIQAGEYIAVFDVVEAHPTIVSGDYVTVFDSPNYDWIQNGSSSLSGPGPYSGSSGSGGPGRSSFLSIGLDGLSLLVRFISLKSVPASSPSVSSMLSAASWHLTRRLAARARCTRQLSLGG